MGETLPFFYQNCLQCRRKTKQIKPFDCSLKKDQMCFQLQIDQTVLSFDNKTLFERKNLTLNPFFTKMIKKSSKR